MYMLYMRLMVDEIYTKIGDIIVSLNPEDKELSGRLFSEEMIFKYRDENALNPLSPHIYQIMKTAYAGVNDESLSEHRRNQSLLISGESGAGKTFSARKSLEFLAKIAASEYDVQVISKVWRSSHSGRIRVGLSTLVLLFPHCLIGL